MTQMRNGFVADVYICIGWSSKIYQSLDVGGGSNAFGDVYS